MKKVLCFLLLAAVLVSLAACSGNASGSEPKNTAGAGENDQLVKQAIDSVKAEWTAQYDKLGVTDRYLEIKNTRVITIKDNDSDYFKDIDRIVEFVLFSNYFNSAPYYANIPLYQTYILYKNGTGKVSENDYFNQVRGKTYSSDFSGDIEKIDDCGSYYNAVYHL